VDPYSAAILLALTELSKALQTPAGQVFWQANNEIVGKLLGHFGLHLAVNDPPVPKAP
jgi:hypothetical protein